MFIIYDFIILAFALIYLPVYLFRRKFHPGFLMRFGMLPPELNLDNPIWIHAVSVGEAMAAKNLVGGLRNTYPDKKFFISTVTPTGNKIARGIARESDFVSYAPLDLSFIVRSAVDKIKPSLLIIMETEIWPNLVSCLYQKGIPIILVNARISDHSFRGYLGIKFLLKPILNKINLFCVQSKSDAERFSRMGVSQERIRVTGNMKFDNADYSGEKIAENDAKYRSRLELKEGEKLLVAGSTHPGEEEIILDIYKRLLGEFPGLKLLIAPRHPERSAGVGKIISGLGYCGVLLSAPLPESYHCIARPVFILDTIGELINFYNIADIVFVGGSLIKKGGHNILEPVSLGKPVIFGPYMFNFRDISRLFLENRACIQAHNKEELYVNIKNLLISPEEAKELIRRARGIILENQGATSRNLEYITNLYAPNGAPA